MTANQSTDPMRKAFVYRVKLKLPKGLQREDNPFFVENWVFVLFIAAVILTVVGIVLFTENWGENLAGLLLCLVFLVGGLVLCKAGGG